MSMSKFFGRPNLGGWLSIFNGVSVVSIEAFERFAPMTSYSWSPYPDYAELVLSIPLAWWAILPTLGGPTNDEIVMRCLLLGLNSIAWGYGLAAIIRCTAAGIRRLRARFSPTTPASKPA